jgi:phosphoglycolate phosphatase-like HAD superfamily hydrolase
VLVTGKAEFMKAARVLALDFDGVICDGMAEYWQTSWRTHAHMWQLDRLEPSPDIAQKFRDMRPLIEVGWEMPVLIRALTLGISTDRIQSSWQRIRDRILKESQLSAVKVGQQLDLVRDNWIRQDPTSWLSLHQFYPGAIDTLKQLTDRQIQPIIITTKEGRFVTQLLEQQGVTLSSESIWGKELKRSKIDSLKQIIARNPKQSPNIWFVEDRLPTLSKIAVSPELESVRLYLAEWGYNTPAERESIGQQSRIQLLSLADLPMLGDPA